MAALLVGLSVMAVLMSMALPVWSQFAKREKEEELIWRGQQYARAIGLFQRKFANTFPPNVDVLVEQRFLRKKYKDPITKDEFQMIPAGGGQPGRNPQGGAGSGNATGGPQPPPQIAQGPGGLAGSLFGGGPGQGTPGPAAPAIGIQGVVSKSSEASIKIYNGRRRYNEWAFVYLATSQAIGPGGAQRPGMPGQPGQPTPGQPVFGPGIPGGVPQQPPPSGSPFGTPTRPPPGTGSPFGAPPQRPPP